MPSEIMDRDEAAEYIGVTRDTLAQMASRNRGPRYSKISNRIVRYRRSDIDAWIEAHLVDGSRSA